MIARSPLTPAIADSKAYRRIGRVPPTFEVVTSKEQGYPDFYDYRYFSNGDIVHNSHLTTDIFIDNPLESCCSSNYQILRVRISLSVN